MKYFYVALFFLLPTFGYSQSPCPGLDSINYSGQWYHTVQIGNQCWLKENLNVGTMKPAVKDQIENDTIEKFCYNNDPAMCDIYGGLYQWREAVQYTQKQSPRGICPIGWHIPLKTEFDTLISTVGANGDALLQLGQGGGTNTSGFSGLLSGINEYTSFGNLVTNGNFWSCNAFYQIHSDPYDAEYLELWYDNVVISGRNYNADYGLSIRCIKDTGGLSLQSPFGGENWQVGTTHKISWGGVLTNKKIKLEYTTDNGISWLNITDSIPATDGDFNWIIPNTPSTNCKVRITEINNPASISLNDSSFYIYSTCFGGSTIVFGGKTYNTVVIANKCWFKENVNIGTMIPGGHTPTANDTIEKYCYNNDSANCTIYGGLYTLSEMKEPGFCPTFWHTPTHNELSALSSNIIYDGNALKAEGQGTGFGAGTNTSGFSALLGGIRRADSTFNYLGNGAWFPVDYIIYGVKIDMFAIDGNSSLTEFLYDGANSNVGGSARCVMDDVGPLKLKSPAGGEHFIIGTTQKIKWTLSEVINIRIDYTTNNGTNWINIIASTPTSVGSYNWIIPNTPSTNCKVKISSTNNSDTNSISNSFQIYHVPTNPCPEIPTVNYAGQTYNTIAIGDQCWMRENLNIGNMINVTVDQSNNGIVEKYCYNNDTNNCSIYGGLYQWDEAMQYDTNDGSKGICPSGWHIPTWNDLSLLKLSVNNNSNALKELGQGTGSGTGTNSSGFSALLSGISYNDIFYYLNTYADFWTSNRTDISNSYNLYLVGSTNNILSGPVDKMLGCSIRCINNLTVSELPVELSSFTATVNDNNVNLNWNTASELNSSSFEIQRKSENKTNWIKIASIPASGNSNSPKNYFYFDKNISLGKYTYRLKMIDLDGSFKYSNNIILEIKPPAKFDLYNAYPNPFNPVTTIKYQVPVNTLVTIKLFDAIGREITTIVNETKPAGIYEVTLNGKNLSSGIYFYRMDAGSFIKTKKIVIIK
jgi:uncharacterized protein (TIGR02145 family)